jgi:DNA-binding response OmpR family regulator
MSNVVDVVIRRLRRKLGEPEVIHTVRGRGYRLAAPER